jgi:hypothetical protein
MKIPKILFWSMISCAHAPGYYLTFISFALFDRMSAKPDPFAATIVIQVRIDENVRMLAELHARWEREDEMARKMKVCTITTSNNVVSNVSNPLTLIGVEKTPTPYAKKAQNCKNFFYKKC